jgi:hypothetical protein
MSFPYDVLERFHAVACRCRPQTWRARCPAHEDATPSLSLWLGRNGALILGCHAGCDKGRILAAKGLSMRDLFPPQTPDAYGKDRHVPPPRRVVATFDYRDEEGVLLYQSVRYQPKDFRQRRPDGKGDWVWDLEGVRLVPYRLPELLARPAAPVFVVEGEGKADALLSLGFVATCNCGGCGMGWLPAYSAVLAGRRVVILPDRDNAGTKHAMHVAGSLLVHGAAGVRVVMLPGLAEHEDVHDAIRRGMTRGELLAVVRTSPEWRPHS